MDIVHDIQGKVGQLTYHCRFISDQPDCQRPDLRDLLDVCRILSVNLRILAVKCVDIVESNTLADWVQVKLTIEDYSARPIESVLVSNHSNKNWANVNSLVQKYGLPL